jgi:rhodanese-related sulfurtransferase
MRTVIFLIILALAGMSSCIGQNSNALAPVEFEKQLSQKDIQLLDVRTAGEYSSGHIKQSLQADWNDQSQFLERVKFVDKEKPVYVYCLSGGRSAAAAKWMRDNGYHTVYELKGGISAWKAASLPVEGITEAKQISKQEFLSQVSSKGLVLADFGAEWCPPCKKMQPVLEELKKEMGSRFSLLQVDAGQQTALMKDLNIEGIPEFLLFKDGREVWRKNGVVGIDELKKVISAN